MSIKIAITVGDPGGIGPDICVLMSEKYIKRYHIVITDPQLLIDSSKKLNKKVCINILKSINDTPKSGDHLINVLPIIKDFERFDYTVIASYKRDKNNDDDLLDRYESLMRFLNP